MGILQSLRNVQIEESAPSYIANVDDLGLETRSHTQHIAQLALTLGKWCGLDNKEMDVLQVVAYFHDIGVIELPDDLRKKGGVLSDAERKVMQTHTRLGEGIVRLYTSMPGVRLGVLHHHENWDGTGYPDGLKGNDIPITSRIIAIVDNYDAMVCNRSYRKGMTKHQAMERMESLSGKKFDPNLLDVFQVLLEENRIN